MSDAESYIWIAKWEAFQHYTPRRDRGPAWIKNYAAQLDDEDYWKLSNRQRALLHDLRLMFATMRARLPHNRGMIEARRQTETRHADLQALNHAGYVEIVSREALEQRLDDLYASRAPAPSREEELEKRRTKPKAVALNTDEPPWPPPHEPDTNPETNGLGLSLHNITPELRSLP